jgi:hypothetical protein
MSLRLENLRRRREFLIAQAAAQRSEVSYVAGQLKKRLRLLDIGLAIVATLRLHPLLTMASTSLLLPSPRNKLVLWTSRLFTVWELFSVIRARWPRRQNE